MAGLCVALLAGLAVPGCDVSTTGQGPDGARAGGGPAADRAPAPEAPGAEPEDEPDAGLEALDTHVGEIRGEVRQAQLDALAEEVAALREEVTRLAEALAAFEEAAGELRAENDRLRREVGRLYALQPGGEGPRPWLVPVPGGEVLYDLHEEARAGAFAEAEGAPPTAGTPGVPGAPAEPEAPGEAIEVGEGGYMIVREWGRTPEVAQQLGPDVPSLRGLVCAIPEGLSDDVIVAIGRRLRAESAEYDNVNIVVYEGLEAAKRFAEENVDTPGRRVLRLSRHRDAGHDVLQRIRGNAAVEIPPDE
ncbi:MAG: hypothetical protein JXR94_07705 [Candidatus Hydrogenedentes bacterium]|nr:hypothetical protein [Candidatus Hydrogenedentota bacterium]